MRAYKWLLAGGRSAFADFDWPMPADGQPGAWVETTAPLALCGNGIHACRVGQLPYWVGPQLWVVELDGQVEEFDGILVSSRARLLEMVGSWSAGGIVDFAWDCANRAEGLRLSRWRSVELIPDVIDSAEHADAAAAGYLMAVLAGRVAAEDGRSGPDFDGGFRAERARQARWLAERLALADSGPG